MKRSQHQPTTTNTTLKRACCVCKRVSHGTTWHTEELPPDEPVSHGYCPTCFEDTIRMEFPHDAERLLSSFLQRTAIAACTLMLLGLFTAQPLTAAEPRPYTIVDTGQDAFYGERQEIATPTTGSAFYGQDAQYAGVQAQYRDNRDGTVSDLNTGLMWVKARGEKVTWDTPTGDYQMPRDWPPYL
jgi:hypothetical protein